MTRDAQDAVQETWLRWAATDRAQVRETRAWLLRTCSRWCLDQLKSARVQREVYPGPWLPEPLVLDVAVTNDHGAQRLELDEAVSVALLTAMERLSPRERAALLLHDVFDHDYAEVATALGRNEAACRKLVSRARARVQQDGSTTRAPAVTVGSADSTPCATPTNSRGCREAVGIGNGMPNSAQASRWRAGRRGGQHRGCSLRELPRSRCVPRGSQTGPTFSDREQFQRDSDWSASALRGA